MMKAYRDMHAAGHAHSVECWHEDELVGGLYGIALGRVFFGESMFTRATDASKVAFVALTRQLHRWGFPLIDCQVHTNHLESLGASMIPRQQFSQILQRECQPRDEALVWILDPDIFPT
jgi:leucyl/phenylalanyl-tRNA--protein transferase